LLVSFIAPTSQVHADDLYINTQYCQPAGEPPGRMRTNGDEPMIERLAFVILTLVVVLPVPGIAMAQQPTVRIVYLVSKDRTVRPDYLHAIDTAIRDVQKWYRGQMNGKSFALHDPVVEVARSSQVASWFSNNPNGADRDNWGFNNTLAEARRLLGASIGDKKHVWVVYSDGPGDKGRGTESFAYLPENDLLGLIGKHPTQPKPARWIGGLGHELGHAFKLQHPADTKKDYDALMYAGFYEKYPSPAYLTDSDKQTLHASTFFR
jgi:hypothetical protein